MRPISQRSELLLSPRRRGLLFRRSDLLLRSVLRAYRDYLRRYWHSGNHDGVVYASDAPNPGRVPSQLLRLGASPFDRRSRSRSHDDDSSRPSTSPLKRHSSASSASTSNVLEDPGVISAQTGTANSNTILDSRQVDFLTAALTRIKAENFTGAVIIAVHHPPFTGGPIMEAVR